MEKEYLGEGDEEKKNYENDFLNCLLQLIEFTVPKKKKQKTKT